MVLQNLRTINVNNAIGAIALFLAMGMYASPAIAGGHDRAGHDRDEHDRNGHDRNGHNGCRNVTGKAVWTLIPAPNDPLGRVVGPTTGNLKAAVSAYLTSLVPNPDGSLHATSVEVWVLGPQDILQFAGDATFTPVPGAPIGTVSDALTLTVIGGSGKYAGATGTINVTGIGYNLFGPGAGPGSSFFDVRYKGTVCTVD